MSLHDCGMLNATAKTFVEPKMYTTLVSICNSMITPNFTPIIFLSVSKYFDNTIFWIGRQTESFKALNL